MAVMSHKIMEICTIKYRIIAAQLLVAVQDIKEICTIKYFAIIS